MSKYIAVDCGKYNTKTTVYDDKTKSIIKFKSRTKISDGTFIDDMFDKGTFIVQIDDGPVYKVGNSATKEAELETTKKSNIHKVCTLAAVAMAVENTQTEPINICIGIPLQLANIPEERISYKDFILGKEGTVHTVKIKTNCNGPIKEIQFKFNKRLVYPEGIGVLYQFPSRLMGATGIIDIGNLNTNNTYTDNFNVFDESSFTDELGGKILISGLANTLTSELNARCDDNLVASTLLKPYEKRFLVSKNRNKEIEEKSKKIIDQYLLDYVNQIKRKCDTRHWPLEFMDIVCIGGTTKLVKKEILDVFGQNTFIPEEPEFVNVFGFLKKMCADSGIDLSKLNK